MAKDKKRVGESLNLGDDQNLINWEKELEAAEPQGELFEQVNREIKKQGKKCKKNCF